MVNKIFKTLGPRTILIHSNGVLVGLITKKDLLKFVRTLELKKLYQGKNTSQNSPMFEEIQIELD